MKKLDPGKTISNELGDFTTTPRLLRISALALCIGAISAFVALGLLKLIAFFTNLFFYQRVSVVAGSLRETSWDGWLCSFRSLVA